MPKPSRAKRKAVKAKSLANQKPKVAGFYGVFYAVAGENCCGTYMVKAYNKTDAVRFVRELDDDYCKVSAVELTEDSRSESTISFVDTECGDEWDIDTDDFEELESVGDAVNLCSGS